MTSEPSNPSADRDASVTDLKLVNEPPDFEAQPAADESRSPTHASGKDESTDRRLPIWMFVVGLLLAVVVIGWQAKLAGELEAQVAGLGRELERSQALVEAHRSHLGEIRGGIYEISEQFDSLRALVEGGPNPIPAPDTGLSERAPEAAPSGP